jgi:hypothetical protein
MRPRIQTRRPRGHALPPELHARLADLVAREGETAAQARLDLSRSALYRALAGLAVLPGTLALIRAGLSR